MALDKSQIKTTPTRNKGVIMKGFLTTIVPLYKALLNSGFPLGVIFSYKP